MKTPESGKTLSRPGLQEALDIIRAGREPTGC